jgi:hypothetical protein
LSDAPKPAQFSNVVLTIVSIIIALGIEHLLGHVSARIAVADGTTDFLIAAQGATVFLVIGAIWVNYAGQLMTSGWEPRFQDFFAPLLILAMLYFMISAIGTGGPEWFYLAAFSWATAATGFRYTHPKEVAERAKPDSAEGRIAFGCHLSLCALALVGGIATQIGALNEPAAVALVSVMGVGQLLGAWFRFKWWRAA